MTRPIDPDATAGTLSVPAHRRDGGRVESLSTAELISIGVRTELLVAMALRRAAGGGLAKSGDYYFERGYPTPSWLNGMFEQLTRTGLLTLADQDHAGLHRVSLTPAGQRREQQLASLLRRVPDPASATFTPPGRSVPAPGDPATEIDQLAVLLAEVVELAGTSALFPGRWSQLAELALEHESVRRALLAGCAEQGGASGES